MFVYKASMSTFKLFYLPLHHSLRFHTPNTASFNFHGFSFKNNRLNQVRASHKCMNMGPSTRVWVTYQWWRSLQKRVSLFQHLPTANISFKKAIMLLFQMLKMPSSNCAMATVFTDFTMKLWLPVQHCVHFGILCKTIACLTKTFNEKYLMKTVCMTLVMCKYKKFAKGWWRTLGLAMCERVVGGWG